MRQRLGKPALRGEEAEAGMVVVCVGVLSVKKELERTSMKTQG